jgi:hypothetical protein
MIPSIKKLGVTIGLLYASIACYGQEIMALYGPAYTLTRAAKPIVHGGNDFSNLGYIYYFSYEHFFQDKPFSLSASFSSYDGYTVIAFEKGGVIQDGTETVAAAYSGTSINRVTIDVGYLLTKPGRRFYVKTFGGLGLQFSNPTGIGIFGENALANGPNYFEVAPKTAETFKTTQIVPILGFRTGFLFWKRLDVNVTFEGLYAYKVYQKEYIYYNYKGGSNQTGAYEATGTGLFVTLGIGYRFEKLIHRH